MILGDLVHTDELIEYVSVPPAQRPTTPPDWDAFEASLPRRYPPGLAILAKPPLGMHDVIACMTREVTVVVALELYRSETGELPASLDELSPRILAAMTFGRA